MDYAKKIILYIFISSVIFWNYKSGYLAQEQEEIENINLTGNKFNAVVIDEIDSTLIWFGTKAGIIQYNRKDKKWKYIKSNLVDINTLALDVYEKEILWIGSSTGINKFNRSSNKFSIVKPVLDTTTLKKIDTTALEKNDSTNIIYDISVKSILIDTIDKDNIWIAALNGLYKVSRNKNEWSLYTDKQGLLDNKVNAISQDNFNLDSIWIGTEKGINIYNRDKKQIESLLFPENRQMAVNTITIDSMYVLFGTSEGVKIYNKNEKNWTLYFENMKDNIPNNEILCIELDKNRPSYVWFGSEGHGIYGYDKLANLWQKFDSQENIRISSIVSDPIEKDLIWATANVCAGGGVIFYNRNINKWYITEPIINLLGDMEYRFRELD